VKILIDHCLSYKGGIYVYFRELINYLKKSTLKFHVFYTDQFFKNNDLSIEEFSIITPRFFERIRSFSSKNIQKYDIYHSSYYRVPQSRKIKIVTTVHDFTHERHAGFIRKRFNHFIKMRAIKRSHGIICISENTKNDLYSYYHPRNDQIIRVIYNGISDEFYFKGDNRPHKKNEILFVGARDGYKNWNLALDLISKLENYKLIVVGGNDDKSKFFKSIPKDLHKKIIFKGFVTNHELNNLYNTSTCLFYPSSYEGFGIPIIESMKAGCPVIANAECSVIKEIGGGIPILFDIKNDACGFNAFKKLLTLDIDILIQKGIAHSEMFSWKLCHKKTLKLYEDIYNMHN